MLRVISSTSAAARIQRAIEFLASRPSSTEALIVGASRGAADDLARQVASRADATFGLTRFSLTQLAARLVAARSQCTPGTQQGAEATAAHAVFEAIQAGELSYFSPVAALPGFPKALARTLHELRLAGIVPDRLKEKSDGRSITTTESRSMADIGRLLARVELELDRRAVVDRAALFRLAADICDAAQSRWVGLPMVLLDVPLDSHAERGLVRALVARAPEVLATLPDDDDAAREAFIEMGASVELCADPAGESTDLAHLRRYVFTAARPPKRQRAGDVSLFSAPGEGREAVEIVRRVLDEAARGVPFDEMAIFIRTPQHYLGLLEHACRRGNVPAYFDRGTRRPDPAGRAFVALLSCAAEGLSARRFDEYLSLGQVPPVAAVGKVLSPHPPQDEVFREFFREDAATAADDAAAAPEPQIDSDDDAVVAGTLRSPWKWEELIVESYVVGGRSRMDGKARWRRRLDGLAADYRIRIAELERDEPESPRVGRYNKDLQNLSHLRRFALPIIDQLADWPESATWGGWLERFSGLAAQALKAPARVLRLLADLRPMADVGPVGLEEARDVLQDRLIVLDWDPPARRYGNVFVGTPHQARGRSFRVVFVPGLAERVVPQRPREDPLLLDEERRQFGSSLVNQETRSRVERLLLKIAIGAASERLYLSYPRLDVSEARARVPSFYALDVIRAITGEVPDYRMLAADAAGEAGANLGWPAPADPDRAIDDLEHDLASLKPLLDSRDRAAVRGGAHYLLGLNAALRRSVISRWARGRSAWSDSDGLVRVVPTVTGALARHRLNARPYSLSALQRFATCPYQFLLATIYRLQPREDPEPLVRMDPLTRGSLFHKVQAEFYRALDAKSALPVTPDTLRDAVQTLNSVLDRVAGEYAEQLAPAIERVWHDEVGDLRRDLGIWVRKLAESPDWHPIYFEFSFGLSDEGRDPRSLKEPILVDGRFRLHGSVDLIERHRDLEVWRVTDHKTGKNRSNPDLVVGGGAVLQPVLYSSAIEQGLGKRVIKGRLYYCTTAGGFADKEIDINDYTRAQGLQVLTIVDRAVEQGFLVAAPMERACAWCDFRPVCGPREEERVKKKSPDRLADLAALRAMR